MSTQTSTSLGVVAALAAFTACGPPPAGPAPRTPPPVQQTYEHPETRDLVSLVSDASRLVETQGPAAFGALRTPDSRWRHGDRYVFVLSLDGTMLVHPDPTLEGKNELELKDINGRPIISGLLHAATAAPGKRDGWYHYEWPVPGEILPRWKSSYVQRVTAPGGQQFVVGSGIYDDRMERAFVVDMVDNAVAELESRGEAAFASFRDRSGPYIAKDAYVFVIDPRGVELVNPAFANLEGRDVLDVRDTQGRRLVRSMLDVARSRGAGWVDYMWPKPGESVSTQKTTYVRMAQVGGRSYVVGCGVYLADAPKTPPDPNKLTVPELTTLVHEAATTLAQRGEDAFSELRRPGTKWFHDDVYFFVWDMTGKRVFHAADPSLEGKDASGVTDSQGRPYGRMVLDVANSPAGEGWVHYMFPEPGNIFPVWKSTYVERVTFPSGARYLVGAGIYNMQMDGAFIEDIVNRAAAAITERGAAALSEIRDKRGPYVFMDTYVFVDRPDGTEVVNPAQPSLEGKNLLGLTDIHGKYVAREYIDAAMTNGSAWVDYDWYRPGENTPSHKRSYVRKVVVGPDTYIVGSGLYVP